MTVGFRVAPTLAVFTLGQEFRFSVRGDFNPHAPDISDFVYIFGCFQAFRTSA